VVKKQGFDWIRLWPIVVVACTGLAGYVTLKGDVANAKDDIKAIKSEQAEDDKDYQQLQIQQTQIQSKVDGSYELLKDLKDAVKELSSKK